MSLLFQIVTEYYYPDPGPPPGFPQTFFLRELAIVMPLPSGQNLAFVTSNPSGPKSCYPNPPSAKTESEHPPPRKNGETLPSPEILVHPLPISYITKLFSVKFG